MIKVNVKINSNSWHKKIYYPQKYFNKKLNKIKTFFKAFEKKNVIFTILLTNSSYMRNLNKKFRKINKSTDVLSFPYFSKKDLNLIKEKKIYLGDIAISYEIINLRAKRKNFFIELDKVWIHGFLHLLGHDHIKDKDYFKMQKFEKRILKII